MLSDEIDSVRLAAIAALEATKDNSLAGLTTQREILARAAQETRDGAARGGLGKNSTFSRRVSTVSSSSVVIWYSYSRSNSRSTGRGRPPSLRNLPVSGARPVHRISLSLLSRAAQESRDEGARLADGEREAEPGWIR